VDAPEGTIVDIEFAVEEITVAFVAPIQTSLFKAFVLKPVPEKETVEPGAAFDGEKDNKVGTGM